MSGSFYTPYSFGGPSAGASFGSGFANAQNIERTAQQLEEADQLMKIRQLENERRAAEEARRAQLFPLEQERQALALKGSAINLAETQAQINRLNREFGGAGSTAGVNPPPAAGVSPLPVAAGVSPPSTTGTAAGLNPPAAAAPGSAYPGALPTAAAPPSISASPNFISQTSALLRQFEGFRPQPYFDRTAFRTGYGSDTITRSDGTVIRVQPGMTINRDDAERDLARRIPEFTRTAASNVGAEQWNALPDNVRSALTSVAYNYGNIPERIREAVRSGDPNTIASAVESLAGDNNGINAMRRYQEAAIIRGEQLDRGVSRDMATALNGFVTRGDYPPLADTTGVSPTLQNIQQNWARMSDDEKRAAFDQYRAEALGPQARSDLLTVPSAIADVATIIPNTVASGIARGAQIGVDVGQRFGQAAGLISPDAARINVPNPFATGATPFYDAAVRSTEQRFPVPARSYAEFVQAMNDRAQTAQGQGSIATQPVMPAGPTAAAPGAAAAPGVPAPGAVVAPGVPGVPGTTATAAVPAAAGVREPGAVSADVLLTNANRQISTTGGVAPDVMPFGVTSALQTQRTAAELDARERTARRELSTAMNLRDPARKAAAEKELEAVQIARQNLAGIDAVSRFVAGDSAAADRVLYERSGGRVRLQPLNNGNFNIINAETGNVIPDGANLTRTGVAGIMRSVYDDDYKKLVQDTRAREQTRQDERFKADLEVFKTQNAQLAQANREQAVEITKNWLARQTPKMIGRTVTNTDGSQSLIVTDENNVQQPVSIRFVPKVDPRTGRPVLNSSGTQIVEPQIIPVVPSAQ